MRFYLIRRKLQFYWKKKSVRAIAVSLVLSVTFLLQYRLANRPEPVQIETRGNKFTIPDVAPGQKLVLEGLSLDAASNLLLYHAGNQKEEVDAHFSIARLSPATLLEYEDRHPPTSAGEIDITPMNWKLPLQSASQPETAQQPTTAPTTKDKSQSISKACSTSISLRVAANKDNSAALSFYQTELTGRERRLVLDVRGLEAVVKLKMVPPVSPPQDDDENAGEDENTDDPWADCGKYLRVRDWSDRRGGADEIETIMSAGSNFRLKFTPFDDSALSPVDKDGLFEPFFFGTSRQPMNKANAAIQCRSVSIRSMDDTREVFKAESADGKSLISFDTLKVGPDRLRVDMRGRAYVTVNDVPVTVDLFEQVKKYGIGAWLLITMANAAILTWIIKVVRGLFS
jgi:hypothetical protein